jgi:hypothetical protein
MELLQRGSLVSLHLTIENLRLVPNNVCSAGRRLIYIEYDKRTCELSTPALIRRDLEPFFSMHQVSCYISKPAHRHGYLCVGYNEASILAISVR